MERAADRAAAAYNLASDEFDVAPLALWGHAGRRTVEGLGLAPGNRVLDVCCGTGSTAVPAAEAVGQFGSVLGVDVSERLLALAAARAAEKGLANIQFRCADLADLRFPKASCDAVICQFGIFHFADMVAATKLLWSLVAPGGALAITTWGPRVHEPARGAFWAAVRARRPDLEARSRPTRQVGTAERLAQVFRDAGAEAAEVASEEITQPLEDADQFWRTLMGSGSRAVIEALAEDAAAVRDEVAGFIARAKVRQLATTVLYGVARRPGPTVAPGRARP
jgi:ubiquinone/menaquinone biosynthesis C-methylase UbiE